MGCSFRRRRHHRTHTKYIFNQYHEQYFVYRFDIHHLEEHSLGPRNYRYDDLRSLG